MCVCWIRGNPLGKWANLSIWTCFFLLCPSPSTVCSSLLQQQQAESSLLQAADGLHMICILDWHHGEEMCVRFCRVKHISPLLIFFSLMYTHTQVLFHPQPGGNRTPVLNCDDFTTEVRWMVHIRCSPNKLGEKETARDRSRAPRKYKGGGREKYEAE